VIEAQQLFFSSFEESEMKNVFEASVRRAAQLAGRQNVIEATQLIQRVLSRPGDIFSADKPAPGDKESIEPKPDPVTSSAGLAPERKNAGGTNAERMSSGRMRRPLGEVLEVLRHADFRRSTFDSKALMRTPVTPPVPETAAFLTRTFDCEAGSRTYKIYVPSDVTGQKGRRKHPLIVMLHGCTQNPDDFAVGTGMNLLAEEYGFVVVYPGQTASANQSGCWNWFNLGDQMRDKGEPSIIAGITLSVMAEFKADPHQVYVAGLSAGGAMAAIMGATYPELYRATGIHSGLAYGCATDLISAFAAMRGNSTPLSAGQGRKHPESSNGRVRTIVFHGDCDQTVHPSNAERIVAEAREGLTEFTQEMHHGRSIGGRAFTRTVITNGSDIPQVEHWIVEGLGHAWSGGRAEGSCTDQHGPDASREMLRFFLDTPMRHPTR
jgi:poly(hydroxyalkanoate) depolymerase family esterase